MEREIKINEDVKKARKQKVIPIYFVTLALLVVQNV